MLQKPVRLPLVIVLFLFVTVSSLGSESKYGETIGVLNARYQDEVHAHIKYMAYARKALSENYPNIAHLFVALAASESVHARNFKRLLSDLGVQPKEVSQPEFKVSSTRKNLRYACEVEAEEIDHEYPRIIEHIRSEQHDDAIRNITYAWKAEKQHRDLIEQVRSATGMLFGLLVKKIEGEPFLFLVCQRCGSTLQEPPKDTCPICGGPASQYKEVERIK